MPAIGQERTFMTTHSQKYNLPNEQIAYSSMVSCYGNLPKLEGRTVHAFHLEHSFAVLCWLDRLAKHCYLSESWLNPVYLLFGYIDFICYSDKIDISE